MSRVASFGVLFACAGMLLGQQAPAQNQSESETVQVLLKRIEVLEKRVTELEEKQRAQPVSLAGGGDDSAQAEQTPVPGAVEAGPSQTTETDAHTQVPTDNPVSPEHYPSLHVRGFADINFSATDSSTQHSGFNLGQFTLHLASPLSKKISYFGEISFTAQPTGYTLEVERSLIRYDYNDLFKISFGRYHTPVNYWNSTFHHGLWLQTTISRPDMIQLGTPFLPVHFVGVLAEGSIPSGPLGLGYDAGVGNGRGSILTRAGDAGDVNNDRAWVANLYARPSRLDGLQIGGSIYRDKITPGTTLPNFRELITAAHLIWNKETPEFMAEFANVHHRNILSAQEFDSQAFYVQLAYRLPGEAKPWKPYYRYDFIRTPRNEPLFEMLGVQRSTFGVRYDISDLTALKAEYRNTLQPGKPRFNGIFLQTSFTF